MPAAPPPRDEAVSGFNGPYAGATAGFVAQQGANPYGGLSRFHAYPSLPLTVSAGLWGFSGYNYPVHEIVIGGEIDAGGFSAFGVLVASAWLRARLGVVLGDSLLLYATGGGALGHFTASSRRQGALEAGWIAGAGFEAMIAPTSPGASNSCTARVSPAIAPQTSSAPASPFISERQDKHQSKRNYPQPRARQQTAGPRSRCAGPRGSRRYAPRLRRSPGGGWGLQVFRKKTIGGQNDAE